MQKPPAVRRFRWSDMDRIDAIESASFGVDAYDRNLFAAFFDKCGELFLVAQHRRNLCGYMVTCIKGDRAEVVSIAVEPKSRQKGVATALMESTLRRVRRRRAARVVLMVKAANAPARRFYEKFGFQKVRLVRRYYEDSSDGILMARPL